MIHLEENSKAIEGTIEKAQPSNAGGCESRSDKVVGWWDHISHF
jgi:hypothetical protein